MNDLWVLDLDILTWKKLKTFGIPPSPRYGHVSISFNNDLLLFGGYSPDFSKPEESFQNEIYRFRVLTSEWCLEKKELDYIPKTPSGRMNLTCISPTKGIGFIFGGLAIKKDGLGRLNDFWSFEVEEIHTSKRATFGSFIVKKPINSEMYGDLYLVQHETKSEEYMLRRLKTNESKIGEIIKEVEKYKLLSHKNLQPIESYFLDKRYGDCSLIIIRSLTSGGDLESYMKNNKRLVNELDILKLAIGITKGIEYMHSNSMIHKDLNVDSIVIEMEDNYPVPKISEFGFQCLKLKNTTIPMFINEDSTDIDLWGLGLVLYFLFYFEPFFLKHSAINESIEEIEKNIKDRNYKFSDQYSQIIIECLQLNSLKASSKEILEKLLDIEKILIELNEFLKPEFEDDIISASTLFQKGYKQNNDILYRGLNLSSSDLLKKFGSSSSQISTSPSIQPITPTQSKSSPILKNIFQSESEETQVLKKPSGRARTRETILITQPIERKQTQ